VARATTVTQATAKSPEERKPLEEVNVHRTLFPCVYLSPGALAAHGVEMESISTLSARECYTWCAASPDVTFLVKKGSYVLVRNLMRPEKPHVAYVEALFDLRGLGRFSEYGRESLGERWKAEMCESSPLPSPVAGRRKSGKGEGVP
jgi:hypothetical protein